MRYFNSLYLRDPNHCTQISMSWTFQMYIYIYGNLLFRVRLVPDTTNLTSFYCTAEGVEDDISYLILLTFFTFIV
jgi:hypothetical protein